MLKKRLAVMVVLFSLVGGLAGCGDDDDPAVDSSDESSEDVSDETSEEAGDDVADETAEFDLVAFCAEMREEDPRDEIPVDEILAKADYYDEQAALAGDDLGPHIEVIADATREIAEEAEGDVVTTADIQAKAASYEGFMEAFEALGSACSDS